MALSSPPDLLLQRATTRYDADEDRILLVGEDEAGRKQALWLTRRLLLQALPHLFAWLEKQVPAAAPQGTVVAPAIQAFTQEAANVARPRLPPIPPPAHERAWLVRGIGLSVREHAVVILFSNGPQGKGNTVALSLAATPLRRWLDILHGQWIKAGWPPEVWPGWMGKHTVRVQPSAMH